MIPPTIRIAAALIHDAGGRILLVRKHGSSSFMLPGRKHEPGETDATALIREIAEEIGCHAFDVEALGHFIAEAANEPGWRVDAHVFAASITGVPTAAAEIAALLWLDPAAPGNTPLAPLLTGHVLPLARTIRPR